MGSVIVSADRPIFQIENGFAELNNPGREEHSPGLKIRSIYSALSGN